MLAGNKPAPPSAEEVEQLCQILFTSPDATLRTQAEKVATVTHRFTLFEIYAPFYISADINEFKRTRMF